MPRIGTMIRVLGAPISRSARSGHATPRRAGARRSGSWVACTSYLARIGTVNRGGFVAQAFEPAGSGDFPVARSWSTGLESPVNPQPGKPALRANGDRIDFRSLHQPWPWLDVAPSIKKARFYEKNDFPHAGTLREP